METRMYFLLMYNLSSIQRGIQAGHAAIEYQLKFGDTELYKKWATEDKTFILLNGGTSNDGLIGLYGKEPEIGSMQQHVIDLKENKIDFVVFREPDANNALTAIAFIVDERVFNKELYPDFEENDPNDFLIEYSNWLDTIGNNAQNLFLREFLKNKKLA